MGALTGDEMGMGTGSKCRDEMEVGLGLRAQEQGKIKARGSSNHASSIPVLNVLAIAGLIIP